MLFLLGADLKPRQELMAGQRGVMTSTNADDFVLYQRFYESRLQRDYGAMLEMLDAYPRTEVRSIVPGTGLHPLAHYKGSRIRRIGRGGGTRA